MKASFAYLAAIVAINIGFEHSAPLHLPNGDMWPPMSLAVGTIFVLRDYSQRELGHRVLLVMLLGAALSYFMASPAIAAASLGAYLASEMTDWLIFTFTGCPLRQRVWVSSLASAPVDSVIFLWLIGATSPVAVIVMTASKWVGIALLMSLQRRAAA